MKTVLSLLTLFVASALAFQKDVITLTEDNHVLLRGKIDSKSATQCVNDLLSIKENDIYLYITSPGGSITEGYQIIQTIDALGATGKNVHCIGDVAASMAFSIMQACPNRYSRPGSIFMQHQASTTVQGPLKNVKSMMCFIDDMVDEMNEVQAERLEMPLDDFIQKTDHDWWLFGNNIIENNAADEMVHVICSHELAAGTHKETVQTFFGPVTLEYSRCPIGRAPLKVTFGKEGEATDVMSDFDKMEVMKFIESEYYPSVWFEGKF